MLKTIAAYLLRRELKDNARLSNRVKELTEIQIVLSERLAAVLIENRGLHEQNDELQTIVMKRSIGAFIMSRHNNANKRTSKNVTQ